jgi:hypothetical protein
MPGLSGVCLATLLLLVVLRYQGVSGQDEIGCFKQLECLSANLVGLSLEDQPDGCLEYCRSIPDCQYFTHYGDDDTCMAFSDCPETSSDCTDCISGKLFKQRQF